MRLTISPARFAQQLANGIIAAVFLGLLLGVVVLSIRMFLIDPWLTVWMFLGMGVFAWAFMHAEL